MSTSNSIETEIKLHIAQGAGHIHDLLHRHRYAVREPRSLQIDRVFDRPSGELRNSRSLLRVRSSQGRATLTYKGPPLQSSPYKSREELEATTDELTELLTILDRIGFVSSFRYEKYRTVFQIAGEPGILAVDETPIGVFLELEGSGDWIDATASKLGFDRADYITLSYASLYRNHREQHGGPPDMVFSGGE